MESYSNCNAQCNAGNAELCEAAPTCIAFINCVQSSQLDKGRGELNVSCASNSYEFHGI